MSWLNKTSGRSVDNVMSTSVTTMQIFTEKAIKSHLKGQMINRILHLYSFHIKFIKLAKGLAHLINFI